ncbi:MAG: single-stranded DNA-binding protein, partial [Bacteroidaceae bacterium]|nr:single-stranded DNA-binding protein [Bacteroidaceae bacterium]
VLLWRRMAEIVERYVHKGDKLYIEGQLRTRSYTDKQGKTRYITEVWADNMEMLTPRSQSQRPAAPAQNTGTPAANAATDNLSAAIDPSTAPQKSPF